MQDDWKGLGAEYPLNDETVIQPQFRIIVDAPKNSPAARHAAAYTNNFPLDVFTIQDITALPSTWQSFSTSFRTQFSPWNGRSLPPNIHLLSLQAEARDSSSSILRLVNIYELEEKNLSHYNETVQVNQLFDQYMFYDWVELSLSANHKIGKATTNSFTVSLAPIEFKTFRMEMGK